MSLIAKAKGIWDKTLMIFAILSILTIIFQMFAVCYEVCMRYFFNRPTIWVLETVEWSLVWMTFLGCAYLLRVDKHVCVDVIYIMLPVKVQNIFNVVNDIICTIMCLVLTWYTALSTIDHFRRGVIETKFLEVPKAPLMMIIPVGFLLFFIQFVIRTVGSVKKLKSKTELIAG